MSTHLVGAVLVHPDDHRGDPDARRIVCRAVAPGEWPWIRWTGAPNDIPKQGGDLTGWRPQSLSELEQVLGHGS